MTSKKIMAEFKGKNGERYYIATHDDIFKVYLADEYDKTWSNEKRKQGMSLYNYSKNTAILSHVNEKIVGIAAFDTRESNNYFTGYTSSQSIEVNPVYRRNGIATAITQFAEKYYGKPYKPTNLLSSDMEKFVNNYKHYK